MESGTAGWPVIALDPNVYVDNEGYHLFYTTLFCQRGSEYTYSWDPLHPSACEFTRPFSTIAYAYSADRGLTWEFRQTPVVMPSLTGFDSRKIETAFVFRRGDTLFLVYSGDGDREGRPFPQRFQIGIARLDLGGRSVREAMMDDSLRFKRRAAPLLPFDLQPGRFDNNVQEPSVVAGPDGLLLYYIGLGLQRPDQAMGTPGQRIIAMGLGRAVLDDSLNVVTRSEHPLLTGVNITEVRYADGAYRLLATSPSMGEFHRGEAISYATSRDGKTWTKPRIVLSPDGMQGVDDWGMMAPTAAFESHRIVLFYTAFGSAPGTCTSITPGQRFGFPVAHGTKCVFATIGRAVAPW